ncbi:thioredoxin family protein [Rhodococcoides kyotonense]|uniref:Thiol-disulfide isomerase or thioredoxin n=1 Tax=Rhodococcoides kyotonense TaxID=398843 RepID=A0A239E6G7_9NOCA|nr:thioredoxin family protein [Rhodococcus kyotonensis]SNS39522.1 Thiol-disulfide isomerase or thioredoxin [Rhodococcus kyotonensis]
MIGITVLVVALAVATAVGLFVRSRSGRVRSTDAQPESPELRGLLLDAGATLDTPTILHFSADWCGPCAAVRRVVGQVLSDTDGPAELELDIDAHPELAREFGVLSLPTTFVLDRTLTQRARISGVPTAAALRSALVDL